MRKSSLFFLYLFLTMVCLLVIVFHAAYRQIGEKPHLLEKKALVGQLGITDLCLFTEATYTRHPSQADRHTPFQDSPMAFEHFPSGSLVPPPPSVERPYAHLD